MVELVFIERPTGFTIQEERERSHAVDVDLWGEPHPTSYRITARVADAEFERLSDAPTLTGISLVDTPTLLDTLASLLGKGWKFTGSKLSTLHGYEIRMEQMKEIDAVRKAIQKFVEQQCHRLKLLTDPLIYRVQLAVYTTYGGSDQLSVEPALYTHPDLVKDILLYPAAACAVAMTSVQRPYKVWPLPMEEAGDSYHPFAAISLNDLLSWRTLYSVDRKLYPELEQTLEALPLGIPARLLCYLGCFRLPRVFTDRLELLCALVPHGWGWEVPHEDTFHHARHDEIVMAIQIASVHLGRALKVHTDEGLQEVADLIINAPIDGHVNIAQLVLNAIYLHREWDTHDQQYWLRLVK